LHATVDLGFADLTSISAYNALHRREYNDWDASSYAYAGTYFNTRSGVFSQEVRLSSKSEGAFSWLAGVYYSNEKLNDHFISDFWDLWAFDTVTSYKQYVQSISGFVQAEYRFTDTLKLIGGVRLEDEVRKQKNYVTAEVVAVGGDPIDFSAPADKSLRSKPVTGKVSLEYKPFDTGLLYVSASKGVKSGGFTAYNVPSSGAVSAFKPETLWSYEGGFKTNLLDDTLQLNGSVFYYDYRNQQIQSAIYTTAYGAIGAIVNAQKSHIYGGELEATWRPIPELLINQSFGYKTGKFDKFDNFLDITASTAANASVYKSQKGQSVGFPPLSYSGSVAYTFDLGAYSLQPEVNYSFHDKRKPLLLGSTYNIASYWLANASLTLTPKSGPWEVSIYGRNIFNQKYDLERNFFISNINIAAAGEPATAGIRLAYKY
ncbi:MAG: TonB-dependent receptor, partial [Rhizomicrobium sp.]